MKPRRACSSMASEEVGNVLLNQRVMAGIGNVFKSEICFACGVNPFRKVATLRAQEVECLLATARRFLAANVADGAGDGIVTYTGGRRTTGSSNPAARLWVYRRAGKLPPLRTTILMRKQGPGRPFHLLVPGLSEVLLVIVIAFTAK
jgi:endonuclease-8